MSRPKGSKNKPKAIENTKVDIVTDIPLPDDAEAIRSPPDRNRRKQGPICQRCGSESEYDLIVIDTNHFLHVASYHRESPETYRLCRECCNELSEVIDKWYLKKGKSKFDIGKAVGA